MYDAIVIGARCAGSPTAMLLARAGYRVLLLDKAGFPSDTISTHFIQLSGVARLARWGLLDAVVATGCPPVRGLKLDFGPFTLAGSPPPADGIASGYAPRRTVLDQILVEAAAAAGVEVRERFTVDELLMEGDRVTGIRGHAPGGAPVTEYAKIVIGADGLHSLVARTVDAPVYNARPALNCAYYSYWSGVPLNNVADLYSRPGRMIVAGPTNDDRTLIIVSMPAAEFKSVRTDIDGHVRRAIALAPELAERVRHGQRTEPYRGTVDLPNFFRQPFGPGWALVGDAGYHKDPITAQGIADAFRDAELLTEAIDAGFAGRRPLAEALARYELARNQVAMPVYDFTLDLAALKPPAPDAQALFGALRGNQPETDRFFGLLAGTVSIPEFFAPESVGRIIGAAMAGTAA